MAFTFKNSSCVVIGTFNIYILQPKYLAEMGVIERGHEVRLSADLSQPGIRFQIQTANWIVRPERLTVETDDRDFNCGETVASVLDALPWTPIKAVGINVSFQAGLERLDNLPDHVRLPRLVNSDGLTHRAMSLGIANDEFVTNFTLAASPEEVSLSINVHFDVKQRLPGRSQRQSVEDAGNFVREFEQRRNDAIKLVEEMLELEIGRDA